MNGKQIQQDDKQYIANTYGRADLVLKNGKGSLVWDYDGKEYIDLGGGIAVTAFGIADDEWAAAVTSQLNTLQHVSNLYYTEPMVTLAKMLCQRTGMKKVFFGNSGAEANEGAIKTARKYSSDKYGDNNQRGTIITLTDSFHGRTITTLAATGQDMFHHNFGPFTPGFVYAKPNDIEGLEKMVKSDPSVCAIMMEVIQGEGGVNVMDKEFVQAAERICQENDRVFIIDEVQTGNGRTGTLFAYEQFGVHPDVVTTAKSLAGGLPMGAFLLGEKVENTLTSGSHGSTFGGNPVCAAGAVSVISRIDDKLLAEVREKGEMVKEMLKGAPGVLDVTGMGLMIGIKTVKPEAQVVDEAIKHGVIALTCHGKVRLLPALNIPKEQLEKAVNILKEVIAE